MIINLMRGRRIVAIDRAPVEGIWRKETTPGITNSMERNVRAQVSCGPRSSAVVLAGACDGRQSGEPAVGGAVAGEAKSPCSGCRKRAGGSSGVEQREI